MRSLLLLCCLLSCLCAGCSLPSGIFRSRWAMDDPEYADKYCDGADKTDLLGKLKQASDARFMDQATGNYLGGGYTIRGDDDEGLGALDLGTEAYVMSAVTTRASLTLMANGEDLFTGADGGFRLQTPSRLAPFVGLGMFAGAARETVPARDDFIDNDDDGAIDELGEEDERFTGALAAVYPELGAHFWWNANTRLTAYGRYMVTTDGRESDDWLCGIGIACFNNPISKRLRDKLAKRRAARGVNLMLSDQPMELVEPVPVIIDQTIEFDEPSANQPDRPAKFFDYLPVTPEQPVELVPAQIEPEPSL